MTRNEIINQSLAADNTWMLWVVGACILICVIIHYYRQHKGINSQK